MSRQATARELHEAHEDARNLAAQLTKHEQAVREREHLRVVNTVALVERHAYRTPIVKRFQPDTVIDHMRLAGETDDTGFSDGVV